MTLRLLAGPGPVAAHGKPLNAEGEGKNPQKSGVSETVLDHSSALGKQALMIKKMSDHMIDGLKRSVRRKPCAPARPQEAATLARSSA
jgi:hypothetical protein